MDSRASQAPQASNTSAGTEVSASSRGPHRERVDNTEKEGSLPGPLLFECDCECSTDSSQILRFMDEEPGMRPCCCRSCGPPGGRGCNIFVTLIGQGIDRMLRGKNPEDEREPFYCEDCREANHLMHRRAAVKRSREERRAGSEEIEHGARARSLRKLSTE